MSEMVARRSSQKKKENLYCSCREREFFIVNLLVRIHYTIVMIEWTGLAPWEFELLLHATGLVYVSTCSVNSDITTPTCPWHPHPRVGISAPGCYRGTSLIRNSPPLGPP